ncbi:hypothetical protein GALMADRAFT_1157223 [Galerina marginata CBS 339.88]|uniref:Uncharacterized protein n=1 Tax=Galerina marginata (strain CBS 339.88) TaxID=685588 RepID=A0A067SF18_GALM3|nr:hypothetical protein GALMADRAFT_1157223 [Galerina marginata CBS 339.88]
MSVLGVMMIGYQIYIISVLSVRGKMKGEDRSRRDGNGCAMASEHRCGRLSGEGIFWEIRVFAPFVQGTALRNFRQGWMEVDDFSICCLYLLLTCMSMNGERTADYHGYLQVQQLVRLQDFRSSSQRVMSRDLKQ